MSLSTERARMNDMMRGATVVETVVVALVLLLVGNSLGVPISLYGFIGALAVAAVVMLGVEQVRRFGGSAK